jgi:hypothetical protein
MQEYVLKNIDITTGSKVILIDKKEKETTGNFFGNVISELDRGFFKLEVAFGDLITEYICDKAGNAYTLIERFDDTKQKVCFNYHFRTDIYFINIDEINEMFSNINSNPFKNLLDT